MIYHLRCQIGIALQCPADGDEQLVVTDNRRASVHQYEAATSLGGLDHAALNAGLTDGQRLAVQSSGYSAVYNRLLWSALNDSFDQRVISGERSSHLCVKTLRWFNSHIRICVFNEPGT